MGEQASYGLSADIHEGQRCPAKARARRARRHTGGRARRHVGGHRLAQAGTGTFVLLSWPRPRRAARSTVSDRGRKRFSVKGSAPCSLVAQKQWCTVSTPTGTAPFPRSHRRARAVGLTQLEDHSLVTSGQKDPQSCVTSATRPWVTRSRSSVNAVGKQEQRSRAGSPRSAYRRLRRLSSRRHSSEEQAQRGLVERRAQNESLLP